MAEDGRASNRREEGVSKTTLIMKLYSELQAASIKVIEAADHNLDTKDWPVKYAAPWEALTELRQVLARHLGLREAFDPNAPSRMDNPDE